MDRRIVTAECSAYGSRFNERLNNEHTYANGGISPDGDLDGEDSRSDRSFQRVSPKVDVLNCTDRHNKGNDVSLPRISMSLVDGEVEEDPRLLSPSVNISAQISKQSDAGMDSTRHSEQDSPRSHHSYLCSDPENNEVPSDSICSMCQREYSEPRLLPCLHSFCYCCLEGEVEHRTENRIRCPKCQRDFDLGVSFQSVISYKNTLIHLIYNIHIYILYNILA